MFFAINTIIILNKVIKDNKKNIDLIREDIKNLGNDIMNKNSNNDNNNCRIIKTKILNCGKYVGETKNDLMEGKENYIIIMVIHMKENFIIIIEKEKGYYSLVMVVNMLENIKMT